MFGVMVAQMLLSVATESGAYEIADLQTANKEASRTYQQMNLFITYLSEHNGLLKPGSANFVFAGKTHKTSSAPESPPARRKK
jgi:hypothetical protein